MAVMIAFACLALTGVAAEAATPLDERSTKAALTLLVSFPVRSSSAYAWSMVSSAAARNTGRSGAMASRSSLPGLASGKRGRSQPPPRTQPVLDASTQAGSSPGTVTACSATNMLEDESRENILFDPMDPSRAVTVDSLPGRVRVGASGSLEPARPVKTLLVLAGPLTAMALNAVLAWWHCFR